MRYYSLGALGALALAAGLLGMAIAVTGCSSIEPVPPTTGPITDPTQLYMGLTLDRPAVTMSTVEPYDTLQLIATPRDALGNPMTGLPAPVYISSDTNVARVSADGLVTTVGIGTGVKIIATLSAGPVSHTDTALINVTDEATPPELASLSIDPVPPDSSTWLLSIDNLMQEVLLGNYLGGLLFLTPRMTSTTDDAIDVSGLQFVYTSLDPAIATVDRRTGQVTLFRDGQVSLAGQATVYGITKVDTATFTVAPPIGDEIGITAGPTLRGSVSPGDLVVGALTELHISAGGFVLWYSYVSDALEIEFDDPSNVVQPPDEFCSQMSGFPGASHCGAGNVIVPANLDPSGGTGSDFIATFQARQFPVPGIYPFHIKGTDVGARIFVGKN